MSLPLVPLDGQRLAPSAVPQCYDDVCITCSDVAIPVTVTELLGNGLAMVLTEEGTHEEVSIALVDATVGDVVLVHAKEAIAVVGPAAADAPTAADAAVDSAAPDTAALDTAALDTAALDTAAVDGR